MSLLGTPLLVVLAGLAVGIPVATVLLWSRVRGPSVVRGGARFGLLLSGQLATVALVAAVANNYGQFYTSWGDLLGSSAPPPKMSVYGAPVSTTGGVTHHRATTSAQHPLGPATGSMQVLGPTTWSTPSQWTTRGKVVQVTISGHGSGLSIPAYVYLPPQYFTAAGAHRRFPAVEVMTGYPGSALNLVSRMDYPGLALNLVRAHRAQPMVYVMFSSTVAPPRDTECTDVPGGPQAETFLAHELPSAVAHGLRVLPTDWGVVGDSTGGYCAAKLAMHHPNIFAGGVSLSGYYYARSDVTTGDLWGTSLAVRHHNDLEWLLAHRPAPAASLFVTISKAETRSDGYPDTMRFLHLVKPPMHVTALIESSGGHNFRTWDRELPRALGWLSDRISGRPGPADQPATHGSGPLQAAADGRALGGVRG